MKVRSYFPGEKRNQPETEAKSKLLNLLVVEDTSEHMKNAKAFFNSKKEEVIADYASNLKEAYNYLDRVHYDGILSDMFFPSGFVNKRDNFLRKRLANRLMQIPLARGNELERIREADFLLMHAKVRSWEAGLELAPMGIYVCDKVKIKKIPIIIVTDLDHHDIAFEPITSYHGYEFDKKWPEQIIYEMIHENKDWQEAYNDFLEIKS